MNSKLKLARRRLHIAQRLANNKRVGQSKEKSDVLKVFAHFCIMYASTKDPEATDYITKQAWQSTLLYFSEIYKHLS